MPCWFYWPREQAVEVIDADRIDSYRHLWVAVQLGQFARRARRAVRARPAPWLRAGASPPLPIDRPHRRPPAPTTTPDGSPTSTGQRQRPVAVRRRSRAPPGARVAGAGVYLRTRFLGADRVGRQLRPHLLRRQGARGQDRTLRRVHGPSLRHARRSRAAPGRVRPAVRDAGRRGSDRRQRRLPRAARGGHRRAAPGLHLRTRCASATTSARSSAGASASRTSSSTTAPRSRCGAASRGAATGTRRCSAQRRRRPSGRRR